MWILRPSDADLPGLANVDHVDSIGASLPQVGLHVNLEVFCANVALGGQEHLDVLRCGIEDGGEFVGSHVVQFGQLPGFVWVGRLECGREKRIMRAISLCEGTRSQILACVAAHIHLFRASTFSVLASLGRV
jgi:hypothetical protein